MFELPEGGPEPLLKALIEGGAGIETLAIERPGLHDAFVAIAGKRGRRSDGPAGAGAMMRFIRSAFVIARRDFAATVLSKAFIFFLLGPAVPAAARRRVRKHRRARRQPDRASGRRRRRPTATSPPIATAREQTGRRRSAKTRVVKLVDYAPEPRPRRAAAAACSPAAARRSARSCPAASITRTWPATCRRRPAASASCG